MLTERAQQEIRSLYLLRDRRPEISVLLVSGYPQPNADGILDDISNVPFLEKPFHPSVLAARIREILDGKSEYDGLLSMCPV